MARFEKCMPLHNRDGIWKSVMTLARKIFIVQALLTLTFCPSPACSLEQASIAVEQGDTNAQGTAFTLHVLRDCSLVLNAVDGVRDNGQIKLGKELDRRRMKKGETYFFRPMVTENLPNLCVSVAVELGAELWCPAISGMDGSLLLAPGFRAR